MVLETIAVALDVDHPGMMEELVQDGQGGHSIAEELLPIDEALVGGQDRRAFLVQIRTKVKNRIYIILDKLGIEHPFDNLFSKRGLEFLRGLELPCAYQKELEDSLEMLEFLNGKEKGAEQGHREAMPGVRGSGAADDDPGDCLSQCATDHVGDRGCEPVCVGDEVLRLLWAGPDGPYF